MPDILTRIIQARTRHAIDKGYEPKYLYLGEKDHDELLLWVRSMGTVPVIDLTKKDLEEYRKFTGVKVRVVDADQWCSCNPLPRNDAPIPWYDIN